MIFSSIPFLYYFLPLVLLFYYIVPKKCKNGVLFLSSLVFYAWGEPKAAGIMILSVLSGYVWGRAMGYCKDRENRCLEKDLLEQTGRYRRGRVICLILGVGVSLAFLLYFKYMGFFLTTISEFTGWSVPVLKTALPMGISFYTFQMIGYLADVYRGTASVQKNLIDLGTYILMFPQLIAGPIVRYTDIEKQLADRTHRMDQFAGGIRRFLTGMGKKVLLADALGQLCSQLALPAQSSLLAAWLYGVAYMLQIYHDFSGYSDMAIGLGKMFGFTFMENFDHPYLSRSISEFWRRWHISLGSWFRDYVYIPMGGNRVSKRRWLCNILVVWTLTGLWHGADWTFLIWGLYFALLIGVEKMGLHVFLEKHRFFSYIYTLLAVLLGFVMFQASTVSAGLNQIGVMFGIPVAGYRSSWTFVSAEGLYYLRSYAVVLVLAVLGAGTLPQRGYRKICTLVTEKAPHIGCRILEGAETVFCLGLLLLMTAYFVDGSFSPFLYFRF